MVFLILCGFSAKSLYSAVYGLRRLRFTVTDLGLIIAHLTFIGWITQLLVIQLLFIRRCFALHDAGMFKFFISWGRLRFPCALGTCPTFSHHFVKRRNIVVCVAVLHLFAQIMSITGPNFLPGPDCQMFRLLFNEGLDSYDTALTIVNYVGSFCQFGSLRYSLLLLLVDLLRSGH